MHAYIVALPAMFATEVIVYVLLCAPYISFFAVGWKLLSRALGNSWFHCGGAPARNAPTGPFWDERHSRHSPLLLPTWALVLLTLFGCLFLGAYGAWRIWRTYDTDDTLWIAAMALHVAHAATLFGWPLLAFATPTRRLPSALFISLHCAVALTVDILAWVMYTRNVGIYYSPTGPSLYLLYVFMLGYLAGLQWHSSVRQ